MGAGLTLTQVVLNASTMITSQLGIALSGLIVTLVGFYCAMHGHFGWLWAAGTGIGIAMTAAWIVTTSLGGGGL